LVVGAGDILAGAGSARGRLRLPIVPALRLGHRCNATRLRTNYVETNPDERLGEFMTKQIDIHGQRVQLFSLDQGRTWSSSPQSIVAYGQRQTVLRLELQKRFARIDEMQDPDPNNISDFEIPMSFIGR
jgi:mitochondrial fission protein ELM1